MDGILEKARADWNFPKISEGNVLPLIPEHDPRLFKPSETYLFPSNQAETNKLVLDLSATMRHNKGIGLAAIQVGLPIRVFMMEIGEDLPLAIFNPKITDFGPEIVLDEGCLSFKGVICNISRPSTVRARFVNLNQEVITYTFEGLSARVFLHEADHLDGITMKQKMSKLRWDRLLKQRRK